ncbi:MAG: hypothetical protein ACLFWB_07390 [Armatimonadota bacterium]
MPKPQIIKLGTVECDLVEATPVVWQGRLLRYEYVRAKYYKPNLHGSTYFRFVDWDTGEQVGAKFAESYVLGCAYTEGDTMWSFGSSTWGGEEVRAFWSQDLQNWDSATALDLPGWGIYNTSVCNTPDGYVMAFEAGEPEDLVGERFTIFFARSDDLISWEVLSEEHNHTKERYAACPALRYLDGQYYMIYLEAITHMKPTNWQLYIARSPDLIHWELSDMNPVLAADDDDRQVASERLGEQCRERIKTAANINNSDFDLCEFQGRTYMNYSWGNQHGVEHLAAAYYDGPVDEFLQGWFEA